MTGVIWRAWGMWREEVGREVGGRRVEVLCTFCEGPHFHRKQGLGRK